MKTMIKIITTVFVTCLVAGCSLQPQQSSTADIDKVKTTIKSENNTKVEGKTESAKKDKDTYKTEATEVKKTDTSVSSSEANTDVTSNNSETEQKSKTDSGSISEISNTIQPSTINSSSFNSTDDADNSGNTKNQIYESKNNGSNSSEPNEMKLSTEDSFSDSLADQTGGSSSLSGSASEPAKPDCTTETIYHPAETTTVEHPAETRWVVDVPAHDEPIYEGALVCNTCGKAFLDVGEFDYHTLADDTSPCFLSGWHDDMVVVGTNHIPEQGHNEVVKQAWTETVVVKEAWTETVIDRPERTETKTVCF